MRDDTIHSTVAFASSLHQHGEAGSLSPEIRVRRVTGATRALACMGMGLAIAGASVASAAQSSGSTTSATPPKPDGAATSEASKQASPPEQSPKSLDDLLGTAPVTPDANQATADEVAAREQARRLEKALEGASMQDLVSRAVDGMRTAADLLGESKDTGLGTQRTQEDVIRALDRLLEEAKRQERKQKGSKSSSSKSGKQQKPSDDPSEQNGQQSKPQQQRQQAGQQQQSTDSNGQSSNDSSRTDDAGTMGEIMESRVEWGQLPERIRELVLQGRRDRVSSMYERLTREYYRRLAEEASK